jgi:hypothetical protein
LLTTEELEALRAAISEEPDLARLASTLRERTARVLLEMPPIPAVKALLSRNGGVCPDDGAPLRFDPWNAERHTCLRCGQAFSGERHHRHWARTQHLWLAERAADLALLSALDEQHDPRTTGRALELLETYEELYLALPNRDNVLGPSHLFFSTYLDSLWVTSYLGAAFLLREAGLLPDLRVEGINRVADEAAAIIGEFNEGLSNRQTWHTAALTAIAAWFGDEELGRTAVESRTGLLGHLTDGFGEDGLWWEGENYHLFALRGLMQGMHWARAAGFDLLDDPGLRRHFRVALLAPNRSALPDFTFPARRDSRYGVSLAQPAFLELWEIGRAWLGPDEDLDAWLGALYALPAPPAEAYDAWLHDAGRAEPARRSRGDLSWWTFAALGAGPTGATADEAVTAESGAEALPWQPASELLASQGLAVLRSGDRYASLECGPAVGGHGHPDRLHLTVHAGGVHWLPDQGTGSYVVPSLAWYRSALAHNAPLIGGANAGGADAWCAAFDARDGWSWCRGRADGVTRTIVAGPAHLLDLLEVEAIEEGEVALPWHLQGEWSVESLGRWEPAVLEHPFVSGAERFVPAGAGSIVVSSRAPAPADPPQVPVSPPAEPAAPPPSALRGFFLVPGAELVRAMAPGLPSEEEPRRFLLLRARTTGLRWVTVLDWSAAAAPAEPAGEPGGGPEVTALRTDGPLVQVETATGPVRYRFNEAGVTIERGGDVTRLAGLRRPPPVHRPLFNPRAPSEAEALAQRVVAAPALDGTLEGFETSSPLALDGELQYRRSEEPWDPERCSARAWANWDAEVGALFIAVEVNKPELIFRAADAPPLELDNDPDDIHSDGLQVYWALAGAAAGVLVVPQEGGALRVRAIEGGEQAPRGGGGGGESQAGGESPPDQPGGIRASGRWAATAGGYMVTLRLDDARLRHLNPGTRLGFDLLVNEMRPDRQRRAGQLVWSGGNGWVYLLGDRHDPSRFGVLELG